MPYTQENRLVKIDTPLGKDVLLLGGFNGSEGISRLFSFELDLLSENSNISFESIIGKNVTVTVFLADASKRYFNGLISRFSQGRGGEGELRLASYQATMVPWTWLLSMTADSRIFHKKLTIPKIVEQIFREKGFLDYKNELKGSYEPKEYCVQYRETDFNFISRLFEEEGIYYFFQHEEGKHTLVFADSPASNKPCPKQETAKYQITTGTWLEEDVISTIGKQQEIQPGKYTLNDYNFTMPKTDLKVSAPGKKKLGPKEREIYDYPGSYAKKAEGERLTNIRMEEEEAQITTITGSSNCRAFTSGYQFTLSAPNWSEVDGKKYVLTTLDHTVSQSYADESSTSYSNYFSCIPFDVPYRPPRITPKPVVEGSQTAMVVGPSGEEIHTDEHGRIRVQFHWDREGKNDENSSCMIRVGQLWAGSGWGGMFIPRIGQEVIVNFLEGDPDMPIITGCVYNGVNTPPYPLPDEKTKSTIKSDSSLGGGGYNEIRFEDKKGDEQIFIHGQKDEDIRIENDRREWIGNDTNLIVEKDQMEEVKGSKHLKVKGDSNEKVDGTVSRQANAIQEKAQGTYALDAGQEVHIKAGMKLVLEAGLELTIMVGSSFIKLDPSGLSLVGTPLVNINSGGAPSTGSGARPADPKAPKEAKDS